MICSKCGKEIEQGAVFCPFCGSRTGEPVPEAFLKEVRKEEPAPGLSAATPSDTGSPVVVSVPDIPPVGSEHDAVTVPVSPEPVPAAAPDVPPAGHAHDTVTAPVFPEPVPAAAPYIPVSKPAPVTAGSEKKKEFFGVGALVACLVVIALLSASTGVFAALYFTTVGAI